MQGNASKHKAMSWKYANKLEQQLEGEGRLKLAQQADQEAEAEQQEGIPEELQRREAAGSDPGREGEDAGAAR